MLTGLAAASLRNQLSALREFNAESMTRRYKLDLGKSVERALALRLQGFSNVERLERVEAGVYDTSQVCCTAMLLLLSVGYRLATTSAGGTSGWTESPSSTAVIG